MILIFDEVITGFAKTGKMFAAQTFGVTPDIICTGKGISNGVIPLGAMIARETWLTRFSVRPATVFSSLTATHSPATLWPAPWGSLVSEIVEHRLDEKAMRLGDYLTSRLERLKKYGVVREVRGKGVLRGVELVKDTRSMEPFPELGNAFKRTALGNGLILRVDPTWFAVCPALTCDEPALDEMCDLVEKSLADALAVVGR